MKIQLPGFKMLFTFDYYKCVRVIALSVFVLFSSVITTQAQKMQGIGTQTPNPRAVLELNVEDPITFPQGFLLPRLTTVQRTLLGLALNTSTTGMGVYDLTDKTFYTWDGTQWVSGGTISIVGTGGIQVSASGSIVTVDGSSIVSQWTTSGTNIYYNGGFNYKVGIGTALPSAQLEIVGAGGLTAFKVTPGASGFAGVDFQLANTYFNVSGTRTSFGALTRINNNGTSDALSVTNSGGGNAASFIGNTNIYGDNSVTGIGYFGTIIGNNMFGAPIGSVVTIDGSGKLGYGILPSATLNTISGVNGISVISGAGYDFTINGANFITSIVGGNGVSINKSGQLVTVTSTAISSQFTTSGNNIATSYNTSISGFITATGIGSFGTIIGANLAGAAGSIVTVDGAGKLGIGSLGATQWITTTNGIYYNKSIGIGNINPKFLIHVSSTSGASIRVDGADGNTAIALNAISGVSALEYGPGGMEIKFNNTYSSTGDNSGATVVNIDYNQNVGIGTGGVGVLTQKFTVVGNSSFTGIGYFGTIIGNDLAGAAGSIVTVDGAGKLGKGVLPVATLNTISGLNGISIVTGSGYDFTINGNNFITSIVGGNGISINKLGQLLTVTSTAVSSQFTTSGSNIATTYNTSVAGFITATGISSFGTIIGANLSGAAGSVITVDGAGKLGLATLTSGLSGSGQTNGIAYFTSINTLTSNGSNFSWDGAIMSVNGIRFYTTSTGVNTNIVIGKGAGNTTFTGNDNIFLGYNSGINNTTGHNNNFFGFRAGQNNTIGYSNNFFGSQAGVSNTIGIGNNFLGEISGLNNTTGNYNNFFGISSGSNNTAGSGNNFLGVNAGNSNTTGNNNIFIGTLSGNGITTGSRNIGLGENTGFLSSNLTNAIAIGALSSVAGSNSVVIGYNITSLGINTSSPTAMLDVNGGARIRSLTVSGSVVTVDGAGNLGLGLLPLMSQNTITGINGILIVTASGYDFTINGSNFITSIVGGNSISVNKVGQLVTVTSTAVSSQFTTSGSNIATTYNTSIAGFITASGIGYFGTIIGNNLTGAAGSVVTVDGAGKLGLAPIGSGSQWQNTNGTVTGIYYLGTAVGIGTTSPGAALDVQGFINVSTLGGLMFDNTSVLKVYPSINSIYLGIGANNGTVPGGSFNIFMGNNAGKLNSSGNNNNYFGQATGGNAASSFNNNAMGNNAGYNGGQNNNSFGQFAGFSNSGFNNNFIGSNAGRNTNANNNNFIGVTAGYDNTSGSSNVFIGNNAGRPNTTGSGNIAIGSFTGYSLGTFNNSIVIGNNASVGGSNMMMLGGIQGSGYEVKVGIGTALPSQELSVIGNSSVTGIGYFGTIIGNNMSGAPVGSIVTIDGTGRLGYGSASSSSQWISTINGIYFTSLVGINGIAPQTGTGINIKSVGNSSSPIRVEYSGSGNTLFSIDEGSGANGNLFLNNSAGIKTVQLSSSGVPNYFLTPTNFGIGTSVPGHKLEVVGDNSVTGIGYFGTIIGNNLISAPGSVVTVDGAGKLGIGPFPTSSQWITASANQIFTNSFVGIGTGNPTQALTIKGNISVVGIGYFNTIVGLNLIGASGSIITVDGFGQLGLASITSGIGGIGTVLGIAYFTNSNTITADGQNFTWNGTVLGIRGSSIIAQGGSINNFFVGSLAGNSTTSAAGNIFIGLRSGQNNTTGTFNNFFGNATGSANTTGLSNNFLGSNAGLANIGGSNNNYIGQNAGIANTIGSHNNFFGTGAGSVNISGNGNTFIGSLSGSNLTVGNNNIGIGTKTNFVNNASVNAIAIGAYATVGGSNMMALGGPQGSGFEIKVGIGTATPNQELVVVGNSSVTGTSSANDFYGKSLTLTGIGTGLMTVTGSGVVTTTSINIPVSTFISTSTGMTYTNDKIAIGTNTVTGSGKFKVAGDGSMGGMVLASAGLTNPISTSSTTTITAVSMPVYIPAGTNNLKGNFVGLVDAGAANAIFQFSINGIPSNTSSTNGTSANLVGEVVLNVSSNAGNWVTLEILISHATGANSAILKGYSVVVKD